MGLVSEFTTEKQGHDIPPSLLLYDEIKAKEELLPYITRIFHNLMDTNNYDCSFRRYQSQIQGFSSITDIAVRTMDAMGVSSYSANWTSHPFHWFLIENDYFIIDHKPHQPGQHYFETGNLVFKPSKKFEEMSVDTLAESFIEKHGDYIVARIEKIRETKGNRPY
ncbi:hypothetical protein ACFL96_07095 [Thermoproteota archaeon]